MKTVFWVVIFSMLTLWVLQTSKTIEWIHYTERAAGIVPVEQTRFQWHPERLAPFLKQFPEKAGRNLKSGLDRFRRKRISEEEAGVSPEKQTTSIRLKNGTLIQGRIVEEKEGLVWIEIEGGKIAFRREEIVSSEP